jgi:hypothetical protein
MQSLLQLPVRDRLDGLRHPTTMPTATLLRGAKSKSKRATTADDSAATSAGPVTPRLKRKTKAEKEVEASGAPSPASSDSEAAATTTAATPPSSAVGVDSSATAVLGAYDANAITVLEGLEPVR